MIWNLGSINIDNVYSVDHLPDAGETLSANGFQQGLGGKGANMSIAVTRAGAKIKHIGAVGPDGEWTIERLTSYGVNTDEIAVSETNTGHANICVDPKGENNIVLFNGANRLITKEMISKALAQAAPQDVLLMQNETCGQSLAAKLAKERGLKIVYAAAPFEISAVQDLLGLIDLMVLNEVEARQLEDALDQSLSALGIKDIVVTLGSRGCKWVSDKGENTYRAYPAKPVDTTGAGDTFTGYLVAGLSQGHTMPDAIDLAQKAGALMVARQGTGDVIPTLAEINAEF